MEPWQDVDAHNGAVEAQNGALECLSVDQWSQIFIIFMRSRIRFRINVKSWIRIRHYSDADPQPQMFENEHRLTEAMLILSTAMDGAQN
jgi:hypothetical protein